nr:hypothetical protein Iba_chr10dCG9610 [Ipomoea batatas]
MDMMEVLFKGIMLVRIWEIVHFSRNFTSIDYSAITPKQVVWLTN